MPRTVFAFCSPLTCRMPQAWRSGVSCVTAADNRWARCDIKSTALLANVLLREQAVEAGAAETILLRDGELTEGSASAVHVVLGGRGAQPPQFAPHAARHDARRGGKDGRARRRSLRIAPVSEAELRAADEIWLSAATREVQAVTSLEGASGRQRPARARCGGASTTSCRSTSASLQDSPW